MRSSQPNALCHTESDRTLRATIAVSGKFGFSQILSTDRFNRSDLFS